MPPVSALAMMRDYLITVRGLVAGEQADYQGDVVTLRGVKLGIEPPPRVPGSGPSWLYQHLDP